MKKKLLIVEDDIVFCKMLNRYLGKNGFEVNDAQTAQGAIGLLIDHNFDLVILDYQLPDQNGLEVLKWIKNQKADVKVFMLSRCEDEQVVKKALILGATDYILKPVQPAKLLEKIQGVLV